MKLLKALCLLFPAPSLMSAQAGARSSDSSQNCPEVAAELKSIRQSLLQTQQQMATQEREIEELKERVKAEHAAPVSALLP